MAGALLLLPASAGATPSNGIGVDTTIVSRSVAGGLPNGPSGHPALSLDARFATLASAREDPAYQQVYLRYFGGER
jgi:hypothetical protein